MTINNNARVVFYSLQKARHNNAVNVKFMYNVLTYINIHMRIMQYYDLVC